MDQRFIELFDRYTHGGMSRRTFLDRLTALAGGATAASLLLPMLENNYARAETVAESDPRIATETVSIPGVADLKGYLVTPKSDGKHAGVVVTHENRGLNPHIKDVTRRVGVEGFTVLAVDCLSPLGGTPEDPDKAAAMIATLKPEDVVADARAAVAALKARADATGKVGAVGFCWGGGAASMTLRWQSPDSPPPSPITAGSRAPTRCRRSKRPCCCITPASTSASMPASPLTRRRSSRLARPTRSSSIRT